MKKHNNSDESISSCEWVLINFILTSGQCKLLKITHVATNM